MAAHDAQELERDARQQVDDRFDTHQVPWLRRLVLQPSCTREPQDVEAAAAIVDETMADLGLVRTLHPDPGGACADHRVYATRGAADGARALALVGHLDTVFPRSVGFLSFQRDGDRIRGPGVLDMKSGLSSIVFALDALRRVLPTALDELPLRVVCVTDEELGSPSSRALYEAIAPATTAALVFEAGRREDRIVMRRKGGGVFTVTAHGRAAHAGIQHEAGVSAIHAIALAIVELEGLTQYGRGVTVNVGLIEGGIAKNTVPDCARCVVDVRFERAEDGLGLEERLHGLASLILPERLRQARLVVEGGITRPPMEATDASQALRLEYESCAALVGLGTGEAPLQGGGSDANLLSAYGVPCIDGLGPFGEHFHTVEEWSSLESLRRRTGALVAFLARRL